MFALQRSELVLQNWGEATRTAITDRGAQVRADTIDYIISLIEIAFGKGSRVKWAPRYQRLRQLLDKCADFKDTLSGQTSPFRLHCSTPGVMFAEDRMMAVTGDLDEGCVRLCPWPALVKQPFGATEVVLKRERVWTMPKSEEYVPHYQAA
ncbi:hypothetical protein BJX64DRAFT_294735 [Aspergillus heterothallicus]